MQTNIHRVKKIVKEVNNNKTEDGEEFKSTHLYIIGEDDQKIIDIVLFSKDTIVVEEGIT